jgi:hypothetical protein
LLSDAFILFSAAFTLASAAIALSRAAIRNHPNSHGESCARGFMLGLILGETF